MQALDDEGLGAFGRKLPWGSYGMLARASITSHNLDMAVKRWCRRHALLTDDIVLKVSTSGDTTVITVNEKVPGQTGEFGLVHVLRNLHGLACWYVDSRIPLQGACFPFVAPPHVRTRRVLCGRFGHGLTQFQARFACHQLLGSKTSNATPANRQLDFACTTAQVCTLQGWTRLALCFSGQHAIAHVLPLNLPTRPWPSPHPTVQWRPAVCWLRPAHTVGWLLSFSCRLQA